uniref:Uncharacterized protein n=1 Tax=Panagrolaimus sp. JU765 TaxID=591449 RepID=A0AC34Q6L7_9BILA
MITKNLALLLAPKGIRVNSLNPGLVRTEFLTRFGIVGDVLDKIEDSFNIPFERGSSAEEQAKSLVFGQ